MSKNEASLKVLRDKARRYWNGPDPWFKFRYTGPRPEAGQEAGPIEDLFWNHSGPIVDKWHHYLPLYDRYFAPYRGKPIRMLEIGVALGGSLEIWRKYFGPDAVLFGIDIDPRCAALNGRAGQVRIGSQADPEFLRKVVAEMGGIDIVLDDGSHQSKHIRESLKVLFPLLSDGGIYVVEDMHATYWPHFSGGYRTRSSFLNDLKAMIDDIHHWYHKHGQTVTATADHLGAMHLHDSMVILEKRKMEVPKNSRIGGGV